MEMGGCVTRAQIAMPVASMAGTLFSCSGGWKEIGIRNKMDK